MEVIVQGRCKIGSAVPVAVPDVPVRTAEGRALEDRASTAASSHGFQVAVCDNCGKVEGASGEKFRRCARCLVRPRRDIVRCVAGQRPRNERKTTQNRIDRRPKAPSYSTLDTALYL